jgi:PAS domain S-box-containing protein
LIVIMVVWQLGPAEEPALAAGEHESLTRTQERLLGVAFSTAPIAITLLDGSGRYLAVNEYAASLTGYSQPELFELRPQDIVVGPSAMPRPMEESRELGVREGRSRLRRKDGSDVEVEWAIGNTRLYDQEVMIAVWWEQPAG